MVLFFPTVGHLDPVGRNWILPIHAWLFQSPRDSRLRRGARRLLRRALGLPEDAELARHFTERSQPFLVRSFKKQALEIQIGDTVCRLPGKTGRNGHLRACLSMPADELPRILGRNVKSTDQLTYGIASSKEDAATMGTIHLVSPHGWSVISDIDDTLKVSEVCQRRQLLENTFLRDFEAVAGMSGLYARWADRGASFHYVSSSPWQLFAPLAVFCQQAGFPSGSFHLRNFRWKDTSFFNLFASPRKTKPKVIEPLLQALPQRHFYLVGDSGEKDPEVYGQLARQYPSQVRRVLIRNCTGEDPASERFTDAFAGVPRTVWQVFTQPEQIEASAVDEAL